jgi:hypothetical protein
MQIQLNFETGSPINQPHLTGQNKAVYDWLLSGRTINCFEAQTIGITALNSRISDLRNKAGIGIKDKFIKLSSGTVVKNYFL